MVFTMRSEIVSFWQITRPLEKAWIPATTKNFSGNGLKSGSRTNAGFRAKKVAPFGNGMATMMLL
jgi:hypothetical protein